MLVIGDFAKAELTASEMKLLWMVLAVVLISVGLKMSKQCLPLSHTPQPGRTRCPGTRCLFAPSPACWHTGRRTAASTCPALGRNGPSLTREATLGVGSALLGFLCQGKEICHLRFLVRAVPAPPGKAAGLHYASTGRKGAIPPCPGVSAAASPQTRRRAEPQH